MPSGGTTAASAVIFRKAPSLPPAKTLVALMAFPCLQMASGKLPPKKRRGRFGSRKRMEEEEEEKRSLANLPLQDKEDDISKM